MFGHWKVPTVLSRFSPLHVVVSQVAVEDRLKLLQEAHRDFGPSSQHFLSSEYNYLSW